MGGVKVNVLAKKFQQDFQQKKSKVSAKSRGGVKVKKSYGKIGV